MSHLYHSWIFDDTILYSRIPFLNNRSSRLNIAGVLTTWRYLGTW